MIDLVLFLHPRNEETVTTINGYDSWRRDSEGIHQTSNLSAVDYMICQSIDFLYFVR